MQSTFDGASSFIDQWKRSVRLGKIITYPSVKGEVPEWGNMDILEACGASDPGSNPGSGVRIKVHILNTGRGFIQPPAYILRDGFLECINVELQVSERGSDLSRDISCKARIVKRFPLSVTECPILPAR